MYIIVQHASKSIRTQSKFAINKKAEPLNELTTFWNCFTIVCYGYFGDSSSARYTYATAYNAHYLFSYLLWTRTNFQSYWLHFTIAIKSILLSLVDVNTLLVNINEVSRLHLCALSAYFVSLYQHMYMVYILYSCFADRMNKNTFSSNKKAW